MPGKYTIKLSVAGQTYIQAITVTMDPRVKTTTADLKKQFDLSMICYEGRKAISDITNQTVSLHQQIKILIANDAGKLTESLTSLDKRIIDFGNSKDKSKSLNAVNSSFVSLFDLLQESDMPPIMKMNNEVNEAETKMKELEQLWKKTKSVDIPEINTQLKKEGLNELKIR
jgi:tRNA(Leu) C34 or U34 (ribose-2'-O)-methylase TrmL